MRCIGYLQMLARHCPASAGKVLIIAGFELKCSETREFPRLVPKKPRPQKWLIPRVVVEEVPFLEWWKSISLYSACSTMRGASPAITLLFRLRSLNVESTARMMADRCSLVQG